MSRERPLKKATPVYVVRVNVVVDGVVRWGLGIVRQARDVSEGSENLGRLL